MIQSIVTKYKLIDQPIVVTNKGGGSGGEGFLHGKTAAGDPHRVTFGTNNEYLLPLVAKMPCKGDDLTPVASLVLDEFFSGCPEIPYKDVQSYIAAAKAKPETFKMGGSQSKDTDQTPHQHDRGGHRREIPLCAVQERQRSRGATGRRPYRFQHQQPEREYRPVEGRPVKPLACSARYGGAGAQDHRRHGLVDIPTCKEAGLAIEQYSQPRTVWLPGGVPADAVTFYADL
jgi:tripartite-type tricarboxylate transporter receptor subunit TctC